MLIPWDDTRKLLNEALKFAHQIGKQDSLNRCLTRLAYCYYQDSEDYICVLSKDFAPYSFAFAIYAMEDLESLSTGRYKETIIKFKEGARPRMNGGLIYHDRKSDSFSVQLDPHVGWSIHT